MPKHRIVVDKDLADIVPAYLELRNTELGQLQALLAAGNLEEMRQIGHKLAGSGGGYGFDRLSVIGKDLENSARAGDAAASAACLAALKAYLEDLEVVYE